MSERGGVHVGADGVGHEDQDYMAVAAGTQKSLLGNWRRSDVDRGADRDL